jgi:hypothetical protein
LTRNHLIKIFIFKKILKKEKKKIWGGRNHPQWWFGGGFKLSATPLASWGWLGHQGGCSATPIVYTFNTFLFSFFSFFFLFSFLLHATSDHSSFFYFLVLYSFLSLSHSLSIHSDFVLQVLTDWQRGGAIGLWP